MDFLNLGALARHAATISIKVDAALAAGVRGAAKVVLRRTREKFGEYQNQRGPFQTWPELTEATQAEREREGFTPNDPLVRTGELRDSYYTEAEGMTAGVGSDLEKAVGQELGIPDKNVPARSTLGMAVVDSEADAFGEIELELESVFSFGGVGMRLSDDLMQLEDL